MKIITLFRFLLLLFICFQLTNCGTPKIGSTAATVEEAESILAKQAKQKQKAARKAQKKAYKIYWKSQSKAARKSVKKNKKRQEKIARKRKRS
jgi:hypothetical protein